jgi:hypothetical protein
MGLFIGLVLLDLINILTVTHASAHVAGKVFLRVALAGRRRGAHRQRTAPKQIEIAITPPEDSHPWITKQKDRKRRGHRMRVSRGEFLRLGLHGMPAREQLIYNATKSSGCPDDKNPQHHSMPPIQLCFSPP